MEAGDERTYPFVPFLRHWRTGSGSRMGGIQDRRAMRMGGLPTGGAGKALAGTASLEGYPHSDKGEFL